MCKILSRINRIAENEGIKLSTIESAIGASRGVLSKAIKNGTDVSSKWVGLICENFPKYSAQWLLTGNGEMLNSQPSVIINESPRHYTKNSHKDDMPIETYHNYPEKVPGSIPLVSEMAMGGLVNEYFNVNNDEVLGYYLIPKFRNLGVDFMIEISGDSMVPRFYPGDIIACSILHSTKFIQWNKSHLIATEEQGLIVKRLMPADTPEYFQAVSENKEYPPFLIPKEEIRGIALVVGSIHVE